MNCIKCGKNANAVCKFCGVALCKGHISTNRYVTGVAAWGENVPGKGTGLVKHNRLVDVVIVENAVWCGDCTITPIFEQR